MSEQPGAPLTEPAAVDSEAAVLGIALYAPDHADQVAAALRLDDFYLPAHQAVYAALERLIEAGDPVDTVSVWQRITADGNTRPLGQDGPLFLHTLMSAAPPVPSLGYHVAQIREAVQKRSLARMSLQAQQMTAQPGTPATAVMEEMTRSLEKISARFVDDDVRTLGEGLEAAYAEIERLGQTGAVVGIPTGFPDLDGKLHGLRPGQMIMIAGRPGHGKALALDTPIPTPTGWTTMGEIAVGDAVLGADGLPCTVVAATAVMLDHDCYRVEFSDGSTVIADAGHLWTTETLAARRARREREGGPGPQTFTTEQIRATLTAGGKTNHAVRVAAALDLPEQDLPVDPYVLGAWLGDGTTGEPEITTVDPEILERITGCGYLVGRTSRNGAYAHHQVMTAARPVVDTSARECVTCGRDFLPGSRGQTACSITCGYASRVGRRAPETCDTCRNPFSGRAGGRCRACRANTFTAALNALGVLHDKHIPQSYLRASIGQRRALLAGLLDTDGYAGGQEHPGGMQLASTNERLARQVYELVVSLGYRATIQSKPVAGRTAASSTCYTIVFTTPDPVFHLDRKNARHQQRADSINGERLAYRYITAVERVESVPVRCIQVDNADHLYLAGPSMIPTHNSTLAADFARNAVFHHAKSVLFFSLEMSEMELLMRIISAEARVETSNLQTGNVTPAEWERIMTANARMADGRLGLVDAAHLTMHDVRAKAQAWKNKYGLDMVVIDYLQLMTPGKRADNRQQEVSEISRQCKILAKEMGVPVVALSQLNRGPEGRADKRPMVSDLRESGSLEQDSDVVMLIHREEVYNPDQRVGEADIIIGKHRGGPTGIVPVVAQLHYSRFVPAAFSVDTDGTAHGGL